MMTSYAATPPDRRLEPDRRVEFALLGLLALLWGSSYLFTRIAVTEIPPLTLIAARVGGAALLFLGVMAWRRQRLPRGLRLWAALGVQAFCNSIAAWTLLAWGQQHVDAGLASVLNSTSPIFVFVIGALVLRSEPLEGRKLLGALLGLAGVVLIVGLQALSGLGQALAGQLACLGGAVLYACAALYGRRFGALGAMATAAGTMLWASVVLVPLALIVDRPWHLSPSWAALAATAALSMLCTGVALLLYFRLLQTLGAMGVASQAYLRAGVGVLLGMLVLGETFGLRTAAGVALAVAGVVIINAPRRVARGA